MGRVVDCYYPGKEFPSVSTTGRSCALKCKHCAGRYLESMVPLTEPEELLNFAQRLADRGGEGFLLSGGSTFDGKVSLGRFADSVREIKATTPLRINAHVGLTPRDELSQLVNAGVDVFSVDVYGDDGTIEEVLGIRARTADYIHVIEDLSALGASRIAPHVCVGIHSGKLKGELRAIEALRDLEPHALVLISLIPTKGTAYESVRPPGGDDMLKVVRAARTALPSTKLLLGCMRSKRDRSWEADAVHAGLDGIVLPAETTMRKLESAGIMTVPKRTCCAMA